MRLFLTCILSISVLTSPLRADPIDRVIDAHVLPRMEQLASDTSALADTARSHCAPDDPELRAAFAAAWDAWIAASHLRFGPAETDNRLFAMGFWPDPRSATSRSLAQLLGDSDPVIDTADGFASLSVAARGFTALETLLYDDDFSQPAATDYGCRLITAIAADIAAISATIAQDWCDSHADLMQTAGNNTGYPDRADALQDLYGALIEGLTYTTELRLGRPMGTFERPRPLRAEARASGRSLRHIQISLAALADLARHLAPDEVATARIAAAFAPAMKAAEGLEDPILAGVATPQGRLRVEILQQRITEAQEAVVTELGAALGTTAGFNSLDGD